MPNHHRRMTIALMTRWFEHVQVGGAFNHTIFVIFSKDSPLGRFADGEVISFDEETLYELADRDYGLDVWEPCSLRNDRKRGAWQQPNACRNRRNRRDQRLYARAHQIAGANRQAFRRNPAATKTAAELSRWRQALAKLIAATYPAKHYRPTIANL
jgi:hypothetical protein